MVKLVLGFVPQNIESREDNHITDEELSDLDVMIESIHPNSSQKMINLLTLNYLTRNVAPSE